MTREEFYTSAQQPVKITRNELTAKADFLVSVDDSLVPPYNKGDILMIQKQPDIFEGELGLYLIGDKPYIKIREKNQLVSLNDSIAAVPMDASVQGIGKVLGVLPPDCVESD